MKYLVGFNSLNEKYLPNKIYVWIDTHNLSSIIQNGIKFKSKYQNNKEVYCISSTRNPNWKWGGGNCRITLDRLEITRHYKVEAYGEGFKEWEERIYSTKPGFLNPKFFLLIEIDYDASSISNSKISLEEIEELKKSFKNIIETSFKKKYVDAFGGQVSIQKRNR